MKTLLLAAALAAGLSTAACSTAGSQAVAPITAGIAQVLPHCNIDGSLNVGLGGIAGSGTGAAQNLTFHCPGQPWTTLPAAAGVLPAAGASALPAAPVTATP